LDNFALTHLSKIEQQIKVAEHYLLGVDVKIAKISKKLYQVKDRSFTNNFNKIIINKIKSSVTIQFILDNEVKREFFL